MSNFLRSHLFAILFAGGSGLILAGCQPTTKTAPVTGIVTVNDEPVKIGVIAFEPTNPSTASASAEIRDGRFTIQSPVGRRRISIMAYRQAKGLGPDGKPYQEQYLPAKFNLNSDRWLEVGTAPLTDQKIELSIPKKATK
ncbi:MAG: hypothetical protein V4719_01310 [Planctomycetota bacterium]